MANSGSKNGGITTTDAATSRVNLGYDTIATVSATLPAINGGLGTAGPFLNPGLFFSSGSSIAEVTISTTGGTPKANITSPNINNGVILSGTGITVTTSANNCGFTVTAATTTLIGSYTLCTGAEAVTGSDAVKCVTPSTLTSRLAEPGTIGGTTPGAGIFTTITLTTTSGPKFLAHSGDPNGVVTAPKGSWCTNIGTPAGLTDRVFINTDGGTTWTGITSVA